MICKKPLIVILVMLLLLLPLAFAVEYTPSKRTECNDGVCNIVLYSGVRFVFQDKEWVDVKDARSLKGIFEVKYLKNDGIHDIEVVDFNYTSLELRVFVKDSKDLNKDIPVKVDGVQKTTKEIKNINDRETIKFESTNILNKNYSFGFDSTVIILQDADTMNLGDNRVRANSVDVNHGTSTFLQVIEGGGSTEGRSYIAFNISNLTVSNCDTITAAGVHLFQNSNDEDQPVDIYYVNKTGIFDEETDTWNLQACGTLFDNTENCDLTKLSTVTDFTLSTWAVWNVTRAVNESWLRGNLNVTFALKTEEEGAGAGNSWKSKEDGTVDTRPKMNVTCEVGAVGTLQEFTVTARDTYNTSPLINISITVTNTSSDFSFNTSTVNGTITINNESIPAFDGLYNIDFRVNDSGGYFNRSFDSINITDLGSFEGDVFQSVLLLKAIDGLTNSTIADFTAKTNLSSNASVNGQLLILIKSGTFQLNVSTAGFEDISTSFTIAALENNSLNVSMGSIFTFNLIRESTNTVFDFNSTNGTTLNIFCPDDTIQVFFNTSSNATQIINCDFTLMQIVVDYGVLGSYFRTLITPTSQKNVTWYLLDLIAGDTAIQKIIKILDLTGEFEDSIVSVDRSIGGVTRTVIDQQLDVSNQVNLFLLKDALYTLRINNALEEIVLGNLIPTEASEQSITLPKVDFVPTESTLGDDILWAYTFNVSSNILRLQYKDTTNTTTLVRFTIFNGSSFDGLQLFQGESDINSTVTFTFNQVFGNETYSTELFVKHPDIGNFTDKKVFYQFKSSGAINLEGWTPQEQIDIKNWIAWIFLGIWGLLFSRRYTGIGMTSMIIWLWLFRKWAWLDVSGLIFGFVALLAVVGWLVDAMRRN